MAGLGIKGIAHWALKVDNIDRALAFYRDTLGFADMMRLNHGDGSLWLIYLRVTDTQYLEIFTGGRPGAAPDEDATAMNHVCLEVGSVADTAADLSKRGVEIFREPKLGLDGNNQCWIKDPDGNRIEFMQMLPGNMQEAAIRRLKIEP
jgi:lactoylglutathione lyase